MRILIVEDDKPLRALLVRGLSEDGHIVDALPDGRDAAEYLLATGYDALILDINLPHEDGLQVLRRLRAQNVTTATILLTARDTTEDVIAGLDAGADDYLRKPFHFEELEARLRSLARRPRSYNDTVFHVADLEFDTSSRTGRRGTRDLALTAKEAAFLEVLMRNAGRVVSRRTLEQLLWDHDTDPMSNVLDVHARRLRLKISEGGEPQLLHTIRGIGFRLGEQA
jgi:two-component system copper resistance phosphate regulon response regulator CusR